MSFSLNYLNEKSKRKLDDIGMPRPGEVQRLNRGRTEALRVLNTQPRNAGGLMQQGGGGSQMAGMLQQGMGNSAVASLLNSNMAQPRGNGQPDGGGAGPQKQGPRRGQAGVDAKGKGKGKGKGKKDRKGLLDKKKGKNKSTSRKSGPADTSHLKAANVFGASVVVTEKFTKPRPAPVDGGAVNAQQDQKGQTSSPQQQVLPQTSSPQQQVLPQTNSPQQQVLPQTNVNTPPAQLATPVGQPEVEQAPLTRTRDVKDKTVAGSIGDFAQDFGEGVQDHSTEMARRTKRDYADPLRDIGDGLNDRMEAAGERAEEKLNKPKEAMAGFGARLRAWGDKQNDSIGRQSRKAETALNKPKNALEGFGARLRGFGDKANAKIDEARPAAEEALNKPKDALQGFGARLRGWGDKQNEKIEKAKPRAEAILNKPKAALQGVGDSLRGVGDKANAKVEQAGAAVEKTMAGPTARLKGIGDGLRDVGDRLNHGDRTRTVTEPVQGETDADLAISDASKMSKMGDKAGDIHAANEAEGKTDEKVDPSDPTWQGPDVKSADETVGPDDTDIGAFVAPTQDEASTEGKDTAQTRLDQVEGQPDAVTGATPQDVNSKVTAPVLDAGGPVQDKQPAGKTQPVVNAPPRAPLVGIMPEVAPLQPSRIDAKPVTVNQPPGLPNAAQWKTRSTDGMKTPAKPVTLPDNKGKALEGPRGEKASDAAKGEPGAPQKTQAQIQAEAEQVGARGKELAGQKEKELQVEAKTEGEEKKKKAEGERAKAETARRAQADRDIEARESEGTQRRARAEAEGEAQKAAATTQGEQMEAQADTEGAAMEQTAKDQESQKIATEQTRQETEIAQARAETEAEEAQLRSRGSQEQSQLEQQHSGKEAAARSQGEQQKGAANMALAQEKEDIRREGKAKADRAKREGDRDASAQVRRGEQEAQRERSAGLRRKRQLEREAERKKADQSWYEKAWNTVKSAVSSLMSKARDAWNAAKNLASRAIKWARRKAQEIRDKAAKAMKAAYSWADKVTGGAISRAARKLQDIGNAVANKIREAGAWLDKKVQGLKEKVSGWVTNAWNACKQTWNDIKKNVVAAITAVRDYCAQKIADARAWVVEKYQAARKWVSDKINAAVALVKKAYDVISSAIRNAVKFIVDAVATYVKDQWKKFTDACKVIGTWVTEQWDKFCKWAQEAFVKFWNGPWRDILIGVAVAVLIAAVTVATGGVGLVLIVAVSAAATGAARMGGEVLARRAAVAIKNDPDRAERFQKEMEGMGDDATRWYKGVEKDESWGTTLGHGAVEGARGAVEGAISGLVGGAGGAIATRAAAGIAKAGAKEGAKMLGRKGVQKAAEWGTRAAVDYGASFAGDMGTGVVNAELDIAIGKRTRDEAYQFHVDRHLNPGAMGARLVGSGLTGGLRMGSHTGPNASMQDKLVNKIVGPGAAAGSQSARNQITRQVVDMSISGTETGVQGGLTSVANGGTFMDGFGPAFVGGVSGHAGRLAGERYGRRITTPQVRDTTINTRVRGKVDADAPTVDPKLRGGGGDADVDVDPKLKQPTDLEVEADQKQGTTPVLLDDDAPTVVTPARRKVPANADIQQHQADRLNKMRGKVEGFSDKVQVVPDGSPKAGQPGYMTVTEARRYIRTVSAMRKNPVGQEALQRVKDNDVHVTMDRGQGSFNDGKRINIDPEVRGRHHRAGVMSHEAHHASTQRQMPDAHSTNRKGYVEGMLRNEAESQAQLMEYHRKQGTASDGEFGHKGYHKAYDDAAADFRQKNPDASPDAVHARAMAAGTRALESDFGQAVPSTSIEVDPVTGQRKIKDGAPKNYEELYGGWHDEHSTVGKKANDAKAKLEAENQRKVEAGEEVDPSAKTQEMEAFDPDKTQILPPDQSTGIKRRPHPIADDPQTKADARRLMTESEGRAHDPLNPKKKGHALAHIPQEGQDPQVLARGRKTKENNTVYRNGRHAEQDLRDILNANRSKLEAAPAGVIQLRDQPTRTIRQGFNSKFGGDPSGVSFDSVTVTVVKRPDGSLHLMHFTPRYKKAVSTPAAGRVRRPAPRQTGSEPEVESRGPRRAAPVTQDELDAWKARQPRPDTETIDNPDAKTLHGDDGKDVHDPKYKEMGDDVFKGPPRLDDVQQGYCGDCFLAAAMGAVVKQRPDVILNMFKDHGDGTVTVTLHTLKSGYVVPPGTQGSAVHKVRVKKDLPVKAGGTRPTYMKGKDSQIWPGLLEKAYAHLKGKGKGYQGINKGGFTTDAMETVTGRKARSFSSKSKGSAQLITELEVALKGEKPVAAGSISKDALKNNEALKTLATEKDVVPWHAYVVDGVEDGKIKMHNPWGRRHPKLLTPEEFQKLFPNVYIGDVPARVKLDAEPEVPVQGAPRHDVSDIAEPKGQIAKLKDLGAGYEDRKRVLQQNPASVSTHEAFTVGKVPKGAGMKPFLDEPTNWLPERRSMHQRLLTEAETHARAFADAAHEAAPDQGAVLFAMRGNTAAGKTRAIKGNIPELETAVAKTKDKRHQALNPDNFKADLMEAEPDVKFASMQVHAESTTLARAMEMKLAKMKRSDGELGSVLIDKRLDEMGDIDHFATMAKQTGRKFNVYDVDASLEMSLVGVLLRKPGGQDPIPPFEVIADGGFVGSRKNRGSVMQKFVDDPALGEYVLFGTAADGSKVKVAEVKNGNRTIHDRKMYAELTTDPTAKLDAIRNRKLTPTLIDDFVADLPRDFGDMIKGKLEPYIGLTWSEAVAAHGKKTE